MLVLHKKKHGINFYTVWFAKEPFRKPGIVAYYEYMGDKPKAPYALFETLVTDLTESEDEIKQLEDKMQKITDKFTAEVDKVCDAKNKELMEI